MTLSIVIPAYNEELRLPKTLAEYADYFVGRYGDDCELIVVANHCSDNTEHVARLAAQKYSQIKVLVEPDKIGKGGAVELGMKLASGQQVGFVDADGSTPPAMFLQLVNNIGDAGCAIGSRWIKGSVVSPKQPVLRRLASRILNKVIVHVIFSLDICDSQCGAKVFRRDVLDQVLPESIESGWAFDIELLCRIKRLGYGIKECPIEWHHVSGPTTTFFVMSLQMLASVWRVKRALART
jgi:glycosyltransferase involved in cell wall biosynthesis